MKMTRLLWRILLSVWLSVTVVCWFCSCHVGCLEPGPEAPMPVSSQDVPSEEESGEETPHQKVEPMRDLPAQFLPENEEVGGDHPSALEQDFPAETAALEADVGAPQREQSSETSVCQHEDCPPPSDSGPSTPSSDRSDVSAEAAAEVSDFDCESEGTNPYDDDSPPLVLENTSNAHTAGTKTHTDPPLSPPAVPSTKHLEANMSHTLKEKDLSSPGAADTDPPVSSKDPEDIPTFDEWKRKMMEVEKEKTQSTHTSSNGASLPVKKVQKNFNNYASVECGAKILGANPEAKSTSSILKENMDMYMLNPCSTKVWFIIELCEPIQLKQLDIANFELFSSTPKDFLVSISDRYPTNKWLKLGTFHARDERTVQSFPLDEHLYAKYVKMFTKYIKVELLSHFGSEHFCPLSLIRVFGTSMMAEYEEFADPSERPDDQDDDLDYPPGVSSGEAKNLIGSAKDVILNMVNNIAVNVLGGSPGNLSSLGVNMSESPEPTTTPGATDLSTAPDSEDEPVSPPPQTAETPTDTDDEDVRGGDDERVQELLQPKDTIVFPLGKEEEEPISSTIILLDKEDQDDDEETRNQENVCCSCSSSCSCAASFQNLVLQRCSAKKRTCQATDREPGPPSILTPTGQLSPDPSSELQPRGPEENQLPETERSSELGPETEAVPSEPSPPAENTEASRTEPSVLEPSRTQNLPKPSLTETPFVPVMETPKLSSEDTVEQPEPEESLAEDQRVEPTASLSCSVSVSVSVSVDQSAAPHNDVPQLETNITVQEKTSQAPLLPSTSTLPSEHPTEPPPVSETPPASTEDPPSAADTVSHFRPPADHVVVTDTKTEDNTEDISASSAGNGQLVPPYFPTASLAPPPSLSDIYAEPFNGSEQNGNLLHGSNQKESVFMRLNNRIKALEVNMSLSGRYLEQLSQRYRKQMEEMQKAFNKTIIKLQNTSRIAEEQDLRQTESIQLLQGQLENVTQLVLNLSARVSQLQMEISDSQNYLLLSLVLCLCLGLLLCANQCRITVPSSTEPEPDLPDPKSYSSCRPESRQSSFCDETGLKRSASYPLIHSEAFQASTEGPEVLHAEETQSLGPANRKRRRRKVKPLDKVETLKPSFEASPGLSNGAVGCHHAPVRTHAALLSKQLLQPAFRDSPSEGSSEASSHSDDPSFCGITSACPRLCDGLPPPKSRAEKRALRRRRPKPSCTVVDLFPAPRRDKDRLLPITLHDIINRKTEQHSGTFVALTGPA
uniref:SUN domain-containing ossification factor n=1 Tax=Nothobranchius korthausae TaxID=1143690 RepID=A0A1A8H8U1_9TELE